MRRPGLLLALLASAQFVLVVDVSIVTVSLPTIARDLHFSQENLQWIITVYGLTFGGFLMIGGRGGDLFGRRKFFLLGLAMFMFSSALCALSRDEAMLIGARALQGLGAAMASPSALSLLTNAYPEGAGAIEHSACGRRWEPVGGRRGTSSEGSLLQQPVGGGSFW